MSVKICGNEEIFVKYDFFALKEGERLTIRKDIDAEPETVNYLLTEMFGNTLPSCEIIGYATVTKPEIPAADGKILLRDNPGKVFRISDDGLYFQVVPEKLVYKEFFIVAYTNSSKFAFLEIQGHIYKSNAPINMFPDYKKLDKVIKVDLIQPHDTPLNMKNKIESDPWPIIVNSGPLSDEEGDEIYYLGVKEKLSFVTI